MLPIRDAFPDHEMTNSANEVQTSGKPGCLNSEVHPSMTRSALVGGIILRRRLPVADVGDYPYETRLNVLCAPLEVIDEKALADACTYKWFNQTLCAVNESVVRLGVLEGEYHWHKHDNDDEFFYVVEGGLLIDLED